MNEMKLKNGNLIYVSGKYTYGFRNILIARSFRDKNCNGKVTSEAD